MGGGGNSHQRAMARAAKARVTKESVITDNRQSAADTVLPKNHTEWKESLNRADSIGLLGILVGTFFVLIVPTVWHKVSAFILLCFGFGYFIWLSHWTSNLNKKWRIAIIIAILVVLNIGVIPQFVEQWRIEHIRSELAFNASIPGIGYPDGDHYGIKWSKDFVEVRLTIASKDKFPIQNMNLSVWLTPGLLAGIAQADSEPSGCVVRRPRIQLPLSVLYRAADGGKINVAPLASDMLNASSPLRDHYDLLCQRILLEESIPLVIAGLQQTGKEGAVLPFSKIHITGSYETIASEGSKLVHVDEVVAISTLPRWK